jgi:CRISPR-associated endonuclease/helicase Cas3
MFDVGAVCEALRATWSETFARLLGCSCEQARRWVPFLIAAHDVGKLHPGFLQKIDDPELLTALVTSRLPLIPDRKRPELTRGFDHGLQSVVTLIRWLPAKLVIADVPPNALARALAQSVGAHHGRYHSTRQRKEHVNLYGAYDHDGWARVQDEALDWLAREFLESEPTLTVAPPNVSALVLILSGLTSICDWIGSSTEDFPLSGDQLGPERYAAHARGLALKAVARRGMLEPEWLRSVHGWAEEGGAGVSFACLFPDKLPPRPVQESVISLAGPRAGSPGLLLVEAPMGEGKTEAALWWAGSCHRLSDNSLLP